MVMPGGSHAVNQVSVIHDLIGTQRQTPLAGFSARSGGDYAAALYKEAQHILKGQVPITPIAHSTVNQPMRKTVQDFKVSPFGLNSFYGVGVK